MTDAADMTDPIDAPTPPERPQRRRLRAIGYWLLVAVHAAVFAAILGGVIALAIRLSRFDTDQYGPVGAVAIELGLFGAVTLTGWVVASWLLAFHRRKLLWTTGPLATILLLAWAGWVGVGAIMLAVENAKWAAIERDLFPERFDPTPIAPEDNAAVAYYAIMQEMGWRLSRDEIGLSITGDRIEREPTPQIVDAIRAAAARPHCRFDLLDDQGFESNWLFFRMLEANLTGRELAAASDDVIRLTSLRLFRHAMSVQYKFRSSLYWINWWEESPTLIDDIRARGPSEIDDLDGFEDEVRRSPARSALLRAYFSDLVNENAELIAGRFDSEAEEWARPFGLTKLGDASRLSDRRTLMEYAIRLPYETVPAIPVATSGAWRRVHEPQAIHRAVAHSESMRRTAEIALRLLRHQWSHGAYPDSLDELGDDVPVDPQTGRAFEYERKGAGFILKSAVVARMGEAIVWDWSGTDAGAESAEDSADSAPR